MSHPLAIQRSNDRRFSRDAPSLPVLFWDIDKTYLNTHFSTWHGLAGIPFESAIDKMPIEGAVALLHALRHGPDPQSRLTPLYFVSASPPQLRKVLQRRMVIDGIDFDGLSFKDQLRLIRSGRLRTVGNHVAYKIGSLLEYTQELPADSPLYFFGDDAENDAGILSLFAQICSGEKRGDALFAELKKRGVQSKASKVICKMVEDMPRQSRLQQIYIHRIRGRKIDLLSDDMRLVVATDNFFQQALHLLANKMLSISGAVKVGRELLVHGWSPEAVQDVLQNACRQHDFSDAVRVRIREQLFAARPI